MIEAFDDGDQPQGEYPDVDLAEAARSLPGAVEGAARELGSGTTMEIEGKDYPAGEVEFEPTERSGFVSVYHRIGGKRTVIAIVSVSAAIVAAKAVGKYRKRRG